MGIPENEIKFSIARGVYDLLTVIPIEQLEKGIVFVRTKIIDFVGEHLILLRRNRLQLKGGISFGNIFNGEQYLFFDFVNW